VQTQHELVCKTDRDQGNTGPGQCAPIEFAF
jgi:hypothetical protein